MEQRSSAPNNSHGEMCIRPGCTLKSRRRARARGMMHIMMHCINVMEAAIGQYLLEDARYVNVYAVNGHA